MAVSKASVINEWIARKSTLVFGTMWMFYAFFIYGLLPLIPVLKPYENAFFYWSGWVQLWALPLLMVGQIVLGRSAEERAQQDHETLLSEFLELKSLHESHSQEIAQLQATYDKINVIHDHILHLSLEIRRSQRLRHRLLAHGRVIARRRRHTVVTRKSQ